jgi:antitoxin component YwqK of YwqJK toxin-antitoxin module
MKNGKTVSYYNNGKLKNLRSNLYRNYHGSSYHYSENGKLISLTQYSHGIKIGHSYTYDSKGLPHYYIFRGYGSNAIFVQEFDTINQIEKKSDRALIDKTFLIDTLENETKFMVALPFGKKLPVKYLIKNEPAKNEKIFHNIPNRISEFKEVFFYKNLYNSNSILMLKYESKNNVIKDVLVLDSFNCRLIDKNQFVKPEYSLFK